MHTFGTTRHFPRFVHSLLVAGIVGAILSPAAAHAGEPAPAAASAAPATPAPGTTPAPAPAAPAAAASTPAAQPASPPAAPPAEPTEEQKQAAAASLEEGQNSYKAGDYATAEGYFAQANKLAPSVAAQYWLAMALDLQGKTADAIDAFEALLANPKIAELPADQNQTATQRLRVLKQIPATVNVTLTPANATLSVDGQPQPGSSPFSLKLAAGTHKLQLAAEGHEPLEVGITVKAAQTLDQSFALSASPTPPPAPSPQPAEPTVPSEPPPPPSKVPAYVTLGVAGASAVVGTIFGIQALSAKSDFNSVPTAANADDVERNALVADMAWGVALTLGITGVVLLTSDENPQDSTHSKRQSKKQIVKNLVVAPYASAKSAGAAARFNF